MQLKNEQKAVIKDFKRYIVVRGYAAGFEKRLAAAVKECLLFMNEIGKTELEDIKTGDIKSYRKHLEHRPNKTRSGTLSPYTVTGYFFALRLFFDYTQKIGITTINPMSTLRFPQPQGEARGIISTAEIQILYAACSTAQEKAILALFYGCGLRRTEGVKLNVRDIDFRNRFLYIRSGKGNKRRVVPITENVADDLKNYYHNQRILQMSNYTRTDDRRAFMLNQKGTRMRGNTYYTYFKKILKRTEIKKPISLHHLRHSIATHLLAGGMKIEDVRDFLGHNCLESTQIYTHVTKEQLR